MNVKEKTKIKLKLTITDNIFEFMGWLSILAIWVLTLTHYANLPGIIPTHYNSAGQADGFGGKVTILMLPLIATVLFIGMTTLNKFPHIYNYPVKITDENATRHYTNATRLIRYLKFVIVVVFGIIVFKTIQHAHGDPEGLGAWFLPLTLGLIFIPLVYFFVESFKAKQ